MAPFGHDRELMRTVEARVKRFPGTEDFTRNYRVSWEAGRTKRGIPTPGFLGTLTLRAGEDYDVCEFALEGQYVLPAGAVGTLFDEVAGRRIAHATLGALLDGVGRELHKAHETIESTKRSMRSS